MDGVFLRKVIKWLLIILLANMMFIFGSIIADKQYLRNNLIMISIAANSNESADLLEMEIIRDIILNHSLRLIDAELLYFQSYNAVTNSISRLELRSKTALRVVEIAASIKITLLKESFPMGKYGTFSLPSGVYKSLRVDIGKAQGNISRFAVVTSRSFYKLYESLDSVSAGSQSDLELQCTTLHIDQNCIRFKLLECIGKIEKFLVKFAK